MSAALRIVNSFTESTGLSVNPAKVGLVLFTRKRKVVTPSLRFEGKVLNLSPSWKMLGLVIDSKLLWSTHVDIKLRKVASGYTTWLLCHF
jgi:hypothetical protein